MFRDQKKNIMARLRNACLWWHNLPSDGGLNHRPFGKVYIFFNQISWKDLQKMSEEKGNLKGLAITFILISLIMGAGVGIVYFVGQSIY